MPDPCRPFCLFCKRPFDDRESFLAHFGPCRAAWHAGKAERDAAQRHRDGYRRVVRALRLAHEKEHGKIEKS